MIEVGEATQHWTRLETSRTEVQLRAERAAAVTIPSIMPPEGHTESSKLPTPYQAEGAKAVNSLASKILLALFPPNTAWFKITFDEVTRAQLKGKIDLDQVQKDISLIEQTVVSELEQTRLRSVMSQALKHLVVTGNGVIDSMPDRSFRFFGLKHFVVDRDPEGNVLTLIIKEGVSPATLDEDTIDACFDGTEKKELSDNPEKDLDLYTVMHREGGEYKVFQELNEELVPESEGSYPLDKPRFIVLRWTSITDENYGRGMVDEYYGDLKATDDMSRDLLKASALAAKVVFVVDPNSTLTPRKLEEARSGDAVKGKEDDVGTISLDKLQDFSIILDRLRDIQKDLAEAFLMHSSIQRDAERVTAEEVRFMAQELEDALGGVYSSLTQDLQVPLLKRILGMLASDDLIPKLPEEGMSLSITTGLDALGRGHEVNKLMQFIQAAREAVGDQQMTMRLDTQAVLNKLGAGIGINTDDVVRSDDDVQRLQAQASAQSAAENAAPGVIQEAVKQQGGNQ